MEDAIKFLESMGLEDAIIEYEYHTKYNISYLMAEYYKFKKEQDLKD